MYQLNEKWSFGSIFSLQTGQPVTYPNGQYVYQDISVPSYGLRNENSLPTYHRLDISATLTPRKIRIENGKANGFLVFIMFTAEKMQHLSVLDKTKILEIMKL